MDHFLLQEAADEGDRRSSIGAEAVQLQQLAILQHGKALVADLTHEDTLAQTSRLARLATTSGVAHASRVKRQLASSYLLCYLPFHPKATAGRRRSRS